MTKKKAVDTDMVDALEVVLERAEWVTDRINKYLEEEYEIDEVIDEWCDDTLEEKLYAWLDEKYNDEGPDATTFEQIIKDACHIAVKKHMTHSIMLELLDEVRANMGSILGRALKDYTDSLNQPKGTTK